MSSDHPATGTPTPIETDRAVLKARVAELEKQLEKQVADAVAAKKASDEEHAAHLAAKNRENAWLQARVGELELQVTQQFGDLQVVHEYNQRAAEALFDQEESLAGYDDALAAEQEARRRTLLAGRRWREIARRLASALPPARIRVLLAG